MLYVVIIAAVRFMGKRQISDLQTSELVVTMLLSDIASLAAQNTAQPLLSGIIPMAILVSAEVLLSGAMIKLAPIRRLICGRPIIVINDGRVDEKELRRLRMSVDELAEELRQQDIFSLADVRFAIVETNGKLSVMKQPDKETPTLSDLGLKGDAGELEALIISDGTISPTAMELCGCSKNDVEKILKKKQIKRDEVFIMTMNRRHEYSIIKRGNAD